MVGAGAFALIALLLVGFCVGLYSYARQPKPKLKRNGIKSRRTLWQCIAMTFVLGVMEALVLPQRLWRYFLPNQRLIPLANIAEGTHAGGCVTRKTDGAITTRFLLAKVGSDGDHVTTAGVSDIPIGVIEDEAAAAEDLVNVRMWGSSDRTCKAVSSAAIAVGDMIVAAASGQVRTLPGTTGTYYIIGRALQAAAGANETIEFDPYPAIQRVVP